MTSLTEIILEIFPSKTQFSGGIYWCNWLLVDYPHLTDTI